MQLDISNNNRNYREDFPQYSGYIPYKKNEVIGMTVGATNNYIKKIISKEPVKEEVIVPIAYNDYSYYNKDYFNKTFSKDYKLDEEEAYSNSAKNADTWISSSKYKIYPQHIPGYQSHVPGVNSGNIIGVNYSKATAKAIKGDYSKGFDTTIEDKYKTCNNVYFDKPKLRSENEYKYLEIKNKADKDTNNKFNCNNNLNNKYDLKKIFKSKIANVPTPGYSGHTTLFQKPISYLNIDKKLEAEKEREKFDYIMDSRMSELHREEALRKKIDDSKLPYISGYKGFRTGVKSGNYHGANFIDSSSVARVDYLNNKQTK